MHASTTTEDPDEAHGSWNQSQPWLGWHRIQFYPPKQKGASFKEKWYKPKRVGIRVAMNWKKIFLSPTVRVALSYTHTHTHTHYKVMSTHSCQGNLYLATIFVILGNMSAGTKFSLVNWLSAITLFSGGVLPNFVQEPSDLTHNSGVSILTTLNRAFLFVTLQTIHWDQKHCRDCKGIPLLPHHPDHSESCGENGSETIPCLEVMLLSKGCSQRALKQEEVRQYIWHSFSTKWNYVFIT